eukprot:10563950-Lingulodinium_polyedra.AAC.1
MVRELVDFNKSHGRGTAALFSDTKDAFYSVLHHYFAPDVLVIPENDEILAKVCHRLGLGHNAMHMLAAHPDGPLCSPGSRPYRSRAL